MSSSSTAPATAAPVLVTGGSGFLGSWCIKTLLDRGYAVHTTVRSLDKAKFLLSIPGHEDSAKLKIFPGVDLLESGSFEAAMAGCEVVLHTASPFFFANGTEEKLVVPAVEGTKNVLTTCNKLGVKKVVLTSSTAAIYVHHGTFPADHTYTSADWSPEDVMRANVNWYALSKTKAERLAWEMSKEAGCSFKLATMNPTLIFGPQLPHQPHLNTSSAAVVNYMDGSMTELDNACKTLVDVRDVALAHVLAFEKEDDAAMGQRFLLIAGTPHASEMARCVREALPEHLKKNVVTAVSESIPANVMGNPAPHPCKYDTSPSQQLLGLTYRSVAEMIATSVQSCLENGFDNRAQYDTDKL
jgi:cinnamoyl-CoA reductase